MQDDLTWCSTGSLRLDVSLLLPVLQGVYIMAAVCYHNTVIKCTLLYIKPFYFIIL